MSIINVENLSKTFTYTEKEVGLKYAMKNLIHPVKKEKEAVKSVSFSIEEGEIVGFLGPNGAEKTTTLKMLSGILHPTSGAASILGYTPWERKNGYKMHRTNKYSQAFILGLQNAMAYRANFFLSLISSIFPMIMQIFLWTAIFHNSKESTVYGYSLGGMLAYVIIAAIVSKLVDTSVKWDIHGDIKDGGLSKYMIRPIGYLRFRIANFLGQKCLQMSVVLMVLTVCLYVLGSILPLSLSLGKVLLFLVAAILALFLNLTIAFIVSAAAFWLTEAWAIFMIMDVIILIASGGVFPLELFGTTIKTILSYLPFQYAIYFPTNILNGTLGYGQIAHGIFLQFVWIGLLIGINEIVWKIGQKKYVAVGG